MFQSADEHVQEVDERELDEGSEHRHEADDDEHVQGSGVANLEINDSLYDSDSDGTSDNKDDDDSDSDSPGAWPCRRIRW